MIEREIGQEEKGAEGEDLRVENLVRAVREKISIRDLSEEEQREVIEFADKVYRDGYGLGDNPLDNRDFVGGELARLAGHEGEYEELKVSAKTGQARKLFFAGIFEGVMEDERRDGGEVAEDNMRLLYDKVFRAGYHLMEHAGDLSDYVELYQMTRDDEVLGRFFRSEIFALIEYDNTFSEDNMVADVFRKSPVEVARVMPTVIGLTLGAVNLGERMWDKTGKALDEVIEQGESAFLKIEAKAMKEKMEERRRMINSSVVVEPGLSREEIREIKAEGRERRQKESDERKRLEEVLTENGLDYRERIFMRELHRPDVREVVERELGVGLDELSIRSQRNLLKFMVESGDDRYDRLREALGRVDNRAGLAEAFLAMDFGEDFGEILLTDAENTPGEVFEKCLFSIDKIRKGAGEFAGGFREFDEELVRGLERGIGERVSEVLYALKAVNEAGGGEVSRMMFGRFEKRVRGYEDIMAALEILERTIGKINQRVGSGVVRRMDYEGEGIRFWALGEEGDVVLKTRRFGTNRAGDSRVEYADEWQGGKVAEAQVNFWVNVEDDESLGLNKSDERVVSLRIDREKALQIGEDGQIIFQDAEVEQGVAALDIGSNFGSMERPESLMGAVIAVGNLVRNDEGRGYHSALALKFGEKGEFARLVGWLDEKCERAAQLWTKARIGRLSAQYTSSQNGRTAS
jgi:hypothetical protein